MASSVQEKCAINDEAVEAAEITQLINIFGTGTKTVFSHHISKYNVVPCAGSLVLHTTGPESCSQLTEMGLTSIRLPAV